MNKLSGGQLAGGNSATTRVEHDFYATDPETLKMFLYEFWKENYNSNKNDCCNLKSRED